MTALILDVETTISNKGNPFDTTNKLVTIGCKWLDNPAEVWYDGWHNVDYYIKEADLLVGFNIKFDLHWLRKAGIDISNIRVWDCQIAEFLLESQRNPYPSLNKACEKYGLPLKYDKVKLDYWEKGVDTDSIPEDILSEYLKQDLVLTEEVYKRQVQEFEAKPELYRLFKLQCLDLLVLEEMEWNGILFSTEDATDEATRLQKELENLTEELNHFVNYAPVNWNSNDHVSAVLYGGNVTVDDRIPIGIFKSGEKKGQVRFKKIEKVYEFPRLVEPLKGTETVKEGYWKVNNDVLRSVKLTKEAKKIVELLGKYSEIEKLCNTYLLGWTKLIQKKNWKHNMIHGNLNQTTVVTGRLSSTQPNLQNADPQTKRYCRSRYG